MSEKPSAAWYLAPIFLGIVGAAIMWFVLKDEDHPDSKKMIKKGWIIGIALTVISFAWIPLVMLPMIFMESFDELDMQQPVPVLVEQMIEPPVPVVQSPIEQVPVPPIDSFEDCVAAGNPVMESYPRQCNTSDGKHFVESIIQTPQNNCSGSAGCFTGFVTRIVDGDTIHTATMKIRLSLTNTPETYQDSFSEATEFTKKLCPVGSEILIDQDDLQRVDQYGRVLAKVFCGDIVLNSELLINGHANILTQYCSTSEFSGESWAKRYGCGEEKSTNTESPTQSCDPSYPDFCIPSPPPYLNCSDIPQKRFTVLQPDPHRFDGDKDGIGCES